ncbi:VanZ family protein [Salinibacterium sp. NK8237]|uniref:VanZ family protein n=1 Tax=Salinibacterium sp. NK8237 TaxID=2792038 RepID=UPI0018CD366E|nr:VanZ family protein [Salinibacterium sp. NK8237]MBH0131536.1 VanZ family protein [Salinibacterium sp. NK8237]
MSRRHILLSFLTFAYLAVVALMTLTSTSGNPRNSLLHQLTNLVDRFPATRSLTVTDVEFLANIALFVPVGLFFVLLVGSRRGWLALALAIVLTVGIEIVQQFIPSRVFDLRDIVSNSAGAAIGVVVALLGAAVVRGIGAAGGRRRAVAA